MLAKTRSILLKKRVFTATNTEMSGAVLEGTEAAGNALVLKAINAINCADECRE